MQEILYFCRIYRRMLCQLEPDPTWDRALLRELLRRLRAADASNPEKKPVTSRDGP